jgi:hypothetical protein
LLALRAEALRAAAKAGTAHDRWLPWRRWATLHVAGAVIAHGREVVVRLTHRAAAVAARRVPVVALLSRVQHSIAARLVADARSEREQGESHAERGVGQTIER